METTGIVNDIVDEIVTCGRVFRKTNNNEYIQAVSRQDGKVGFSSGSEGRHIIRRADLLRKRVPSRRGGV